MNNFKAFEDETLDLGSLNILTGLNSSGKSSVIQALRLLCDHTSPEEMGALRDYIRHDAEQTNLSCQYNGNNKLIHFGRKEKRNDLLRDSITSSPMVPPARSIVSYISADRYGPRTTLPLFIDDDVKTVGPKGEHLVDFLHYLENDKFGQLKTPEVLSVDNETGLRQSIQAWMRKIAPGIDLDYKTYDQADLGSLVWNNYRPVHVGFGLSYTLPIVASVLVHSAQLMSRNVTPYVLIMIENPEAHLHPSGQTMMGKLLALAAACGIQIVVETHSDHFFNGVRLAVKNQALSPEQVACYFFKNSYKTNAYQQQDPAQVERIYIDRHGMMDDWPEGFFDETEKSLLQLL